MSKIETLTMELAKECREKGLNFVIAIEDNGIHNQCSVKGKTDLRQLVKVLKEITKK